MLPPAGACEGGIIRIQPGQSGCIFRQKCIREHIARAEKLFEHRSPSGCPETAALDCKIHQIKCPDKSRLGHILPSFKHPFGRTSHLTADIRHLQHKRHGSPSLNIRYSRECHTMKELTTLTILSLIEGSSTSRLGLPWRGLILIMESNSMKSSPSISG